MSKNLPTFQQLREQVNKGIMGLLVLISFIATATTWYILDKNPSLDKALMISSLEELIKTYRFILLFFAILFELFIWKINMPKYVTATITTLLFIIGFCFSISDLVAFGIISLISAILLVFTETLFFKN